MIFNGVIEFLLELQTWLKLRFLWFFKNSSSTLEQGNDLELGAQIGQVERETPALQVSQIPSGDLNMAIEDTPIFIIFHIFSETFSTARNVP